MYTHTDTQTNTHTHTHDGILLSHEKYEIFPFATARVALEGVLPSEMSQRKTNTL